MIGVGGASPARRSTNGRGWLLVALALGSLASCAGLGCGSCPPPLPDGPGLAALGGGASTPGRAAGGGLPFRRLLVSLAYYYGPGTARGPSPLPSRPDQAQCADNVRFFYRHALDPATTDVVVSVIGNSQLPPMPPAGMGVTFRRHACNGGTVEPLFVHATLLSALRASGALGRYSHFAVMSCAARGPYVLAEPAACPTAFASWRSDTESGPRWLYPFAARLGATSSRSNASASSPAVAALVGPTVSFQDGYAHVQLSSFAVTSLPHVDRFIWAIGRKRGGPSNAAGGCSVPVDGKKALAGGGGRLAWLDARPPSLSEQKQDARAVGRGARFASRACALGSERDWSSQRFEPVGCVLGESVRQEATGAPQATESVQPPLGGRRLAIASTASAAGQAELPAHNRSEQQEDGGSASDALSADAALFRMRVREAIGGLRGKSTRVRMATDVFLSQLTLHDGLNIQSLMPRQQGWDYRRCTFSREPPSRAELTARSLDADPALTSEGARPLELIFVRYGGEPMAEGRLHGLLCNCTRSAEALDGSGELRLSTARPGVEARRGELGGTAVARPVPLDAPSANASRVAVKQATAAAAERWAVPLRLWEAEQKGYVQARLGEYTARNRRVPRLDRLPPCDEACPACEPFARAVLPVRITEEPERLLTAEIAVAQCAYPLAFLERVTADVERRGGGLRLVRVTVYSKCGQTPTVPSLHGTGATVRVQTLPNVGRCDHTWAHHLAAHYASLADVVLLIKDSHESYPVERLRALAVGVPEALQQARVGGFACFRGAELSPSRWHVRSEVLSFRMASYASAALLAPVAAVADAEWRSNGSRFTSPLDMFEFLARALSEDELLRLLEADVVPVCYGGSFAVTRRRVHAVGQPTFSRLRALLDRGADSIEEGHYMERTWAALLAPTMTPTESAAFRTGVGGDFWPRPASGRAAPKQLGKGHGTQGNTYGGIAKRCCCERVRLQST